jgi:hypothetical protein
MFVRFRETKSRLQASLIQTRRVDGRVRHEHLAQLGSIETPLSVRARLDFWHRLHDRLAKLGNRVDPATQAKVLGEVHARIPMVTPDEQRALQLANARADAETWGTLADMHAGTVEGHAGLIASAERAKATATAEHAKASEHAARAEDRIARIERGEDVADGKPLTIEDLIEAGMTKADITRCVQMHEVSDAFGFDTVVEAIREATERAERSTLRALHRLIPDEGGEN